MIGELVMLLAGLMTLTVAAAAEELAPRFAAVGLPLLLAAAAVVARRRSVPVAIAFALAAGALEDSLSSLAPGCAAVYFMAAAALTSLEAVPTPVLWLLYPVFQIWLAVWMRVTIAELFVRMLVAVPLGAAAILLMTWFVRYLDRKAAIDA